MKPIIDKTAVLSNQARARAMALHGADFLLRRLAEELTDRLMVQNRIFDSAVYIGPKSELVDSVIRASGKVGTCLHVDPADFATDETLPLEIQSIDIIISLAHLHEANDVPGLLVQMRRGLKPDGLLIACIPGGDTLQELRSALMHAEAEICGGASPRVLPFMDVRVAGGLLQRAGFALPVADLDSVIVRYRSFADLIRDLRGMGATNSMVERSRRIVPRQFFGRVAQLLAQDHSDPDGRFRTTFSFLWLSGWAPHASQPKALKPGSAKTSLAAVLKDRSG